MRPKSQKQLSVTTIVRQSQCTVTEPAREKYVTKVAVPWHWLCSLLKRPQMTHTGRSCDILTTYYNERDAEQDLLYCAVVKSCKTKADCMHAVMPS